MRVIASELFNLLLSENLIKEWPYGSDGADIYHPQGAKRVFLVVMQHWAELFGESDPHCRKGHLNIVISLCDQLLPRAIDEGFTQKSMLFNCDKYPDFLRSLRSLFVLLNDNNRVRYIDEFLRPFDHPMPGLTLVQSQWDETCTVLFHLKDDPQCLNFSPIGYDTGPHIPELSEWPLLKIPTYKHQCHGQSRKLEREFEENFGFDKKW